MGQSSRSILRRDNMRTDFGKFELNFKGWCYLKPEEVVTSTETLANYFRNASWNPSINWQITTRDPTSEVPLVSLPRREGLAYVALNLVFTTTEGGIDRLANQTNCRAYFNDLSNNLLWPYIEKSREKISIDFVTWDLAPSWGWSRAFSRYWLKGSTQVLTTEQKKLPAYNIGKVVRQLTTLDGQCRRDTSHDGCPKGAVLECIKHLLRTAQQEIADVREAADDGPLREQFDNRSCAEEEHIHTAVQANIHRILAANHSIQAILHILTKNVGLGRSSFVLMRILRRIFNRPKYLNMVVTDETFQGKKESISGDYSYFQVISRTMAGHIRLRTASMRDTLRSAIQSAADETLEQTQLVGYFGLVAAEVGEQDQHDAALDKVGGRYFDAFEDVVDDIEALIQVLDNEYAVNGEKMFKRKRKAVPEGTPRCLLEKADLNEKLYKVENDSDSELNVEYNEKY
ncbi:hypothetical protein QBC41DRAFT_353778 [Cercophora samala]|uniref:Uncharacterized protein n=1 Tax=Cercophora samala TaxID=330535 RepID=A0AA40DCW3_9PEZI|nr:hypothetical protein QBC41DRAFT_353778 [Cercophora samala]